MSETYTRKELDSMSRVELRRLAVQVHGMDNKECSNTKSEQIKDFIEEAQGGGGSKSSSKSKGSSKSRSSKGSSKSSSSSSKSNGASRSRRSSKPDPEPEAEASEGVVADLGPVIERIDALGKTLDEGREATKEELEGISEQLCDIDRKLFILTGLSCDLYKAMYEPDDLDPRIEELEAEYEADDSEGNEDEGND